jgi:hypothetical protein
MAQDADFRAVEVQSSLAFSTCKTAVGLLPHIDESTAHKALAHDYLHFGLGLGPGLAPRLGQLIVYWHMRWEVGGRWRLAVVLVPCGHHDVEGVDMGCQLNPFISIITNQTNKHNATQINANGEKHR